MERDKGNPYHTYCYEFQQSLMNYGNGNWFGRLIAFQGQINILGNVYSQEDIESLFENSNIQITKIETDYSTVSFTPDNSGSSENYQNGTIQCNAEIEMIVNGVTLNDTYSITHQVKPAFQTKITTI